MMRRWTIVLMLLVFASAVFASAVSAQDGGQLWVNAFEDRDGDGSRDPNEPFVTRNVSVVLQDANGVVIASALLDDSPNASRGLIGFQRLPPGTYTVIVSSPDLTPTTPDTFTQAIELGGMPTLLWYGGQRLSSALEPADAGSPALTMDAELMRIVIALLGALIVVAVLSVIGVFIYLIAYARRAPKPVRSATSSTGSMRAVRMDDTGEIRSTRG